MRTVSGHLRYRTGIAAMLLSICLLPARGLAQQPAQPQSAPAQPQPAPAQRQPAPAQPQTSPAVPGDTSQDERARTLFIAGDSHYARGQYEQAIEAFRDSYRLSGRPMILIALANSYERLARYDEALEALRRYQPDAQPAEAEAIRERIEALDKRAAEQRAAATKREQAAVAPPQQPAAPAMPVPAPPVKKRVRPLAGWLLVAAGGAALAGGAYLGVSARSERDAIGDQCREAGGKTLCMLTARPHIDEDQTLSTRADVSAAVGVVALVAGAALLVFNSKEVPVAREAPAASPVVSFGPGTVEVGLVGHF